MTVKELKMALDDYPDNIEIFVRSGDACVHALDTHDVCMVPVDDTLYVEDTEVPSHVIVDPDNPYVIGVLIDWRRDNDKN